MKLLLLLLLLWLVFGCAAKPDQCKVKASTSKMVQCEWVIKRR